MAGRPLTPVLRDATALYLVKDCNKKLPKYSSCECILLKILKVTGSKVKVT